jgi:hypothetical protein
VFLWCSPNYDVVFKISNRLKVNNDNFKFNGNFKNHVIVERIPREHLAFLIYIYIYIYIFTSNQMEPKAALLEQVIIVF